MNPKNEPRSARREDSLPFEAEEFDARRDSFKAFWQVYPKPDGEAAAKKAWASAIGKASPERIIEGAINYREKRARDPRDPATVEHFTTLAANWLKEERWNDAVPNYAAADARRGGGGVFAQGMAVAAEMDEPERESWE